MKPVGFRYTNTYELCVQKREAYVSLHFYCRCMHMHMHIHTPQNYVMW